MKKLLVLGLIVLFSSCSVLKGVSTEGFTIAGNVVSYKGEQIAELTALEFALDNNKLVKEMSFTLLNNSNNDKVVNLIAFLHQQYSEFEIEINIPFEHSEGLH